MSNMNIFDRATTAAMRQDIENIESEIGRLLLDFKLKYNVGLRIETVEKTDDEGNIETLGVFLYMRPLLRESRDPNHPLWKPAAQQGE